MLELVSEDPAIPADKRVTEPRIAPLKLPATSAGKQAIVPQLVKVEEVQHTQISTGTQEAKSLATIAGKTAIEAPSAPIKVFVTSVERQDIKPGNVLEGKGVAAEGTPVVLRVART